MQCGLWSTGREYREQGAESILALYLRRPHGWLVVVGDPRARVVPTDQIKYRHCVGPNNERLVEIWGPKKMIDGLKESKCQVLIPNSEGATTNTEESNL